MKKEGILVAVTGASGSAYGVKLVETLAGPLGIEVGLVVSRAGRIVMAHELGVDTGGEDFPARLFSPDALSRITYFEPEDLSMPFSSGSRGFRALLIVPCSMNTVAAISAGITLNLVHRLADVALKEGRKVVVVPREAPLSVTHLENLLDLAGKGVTVLPASPGFYHRPETVDDLVNFVVGRILDQLDLDHNLYKRWRQ